MAGIDPPEGCAKCDNGWRRVQEPYVLHLAPDPTDELVATLAEHDRGDELVAELWRRLEARRAAIRCSFYPCRDCRPNLFYRWAGGHFMPDHVAGACPECIEVHGRRATSSGRRREPAPASAGPPPMREF